MSQLTEANSPLPAKKSEVRIVDNFSARKSEVKIASRGGPWSKPEGWWRYARAGHVALHGFAFRVPGLGFQIRDSDVGFRSSGFRFWISGIGIRASGSGFRDSGMGCQVSGFGIRVLGGPASPPTESFP